MQPLLTRIKHPYIGLRLALKTRGKKEIVSKKIVFPSVHGIFEIYKCSFFCANVHIGCLLFSSSVLAIKQSYLIYQFQQCLRIQDSIPHMWNGKTLRQQCKVSECCLSKQLHLKTHSNIGHLQPCCHKNPQLYYRPVMYYILSGYLLRWGMDK